MLRPQSLQRPSDDFWPGDPAFVQPPERVDGQSDEEWHKALDEHQRKLTVARETGNWQPMLAGDGQPTKFVLRRIPGDVYRKLTDDALFGRVGPGEYAQLLVRCALIDVVNLGEARVELGRHERYGKIASVDITNALDQIDTRIVRDLAELLRQRHEAVSPKSSRD